MSDEIEQRYCITARNRLNGITEAISDSMTKSETRTWLATGRKHAFKTHVYFRSSKFPFKPHKK